LPERRSRYETTGPDVRHQARTPVPRGARPRFVILRISERRRHEAMNTGPVEAYAGLRRRYTRTPAITNATAARPPPSQPIGTFGLAPSSPRAAIATGTRVEDVVVGGMVVVVVELVVVVGGTVVVDVVDDVVVVSGGGSVVVVVVVARVVVVGARVVVVGARVVVVGAAVVVVAGGGVLTVSVKAARLPPSMNSYL
jgi:hypothetical protein